MIALGDDLDRFGKSAEDICLGTGGEGEESVGLDVKCRRVLDEKKGEEGEQEEERKGEG